MKILLIGPSAAGKTTLIQRLIDERLSMIRRRQWSILAILLTHRVNICSRGDTGVL